MFDDPPAPLKLGKSGKRKERARLEEEVEERPKVGKSKGKRMKG